MDGLNSSAMSALLLAFQENLQTASRFQAGLYTVLIYDHRPFNTLHWQVLTLNQEIETIWNRPWTSATVFFMINRYLTPLELIVVMVGFPAEWPLETCVYQVSSEDARFDSLIGVNALCVIMILRVYALYGGSRIALGLLSLVFCSQIAVQSYVLAKSFAVQAVIPGAPGCILVGQTQLFSGLWIAPLVTDSVIFILTLWWAKTHVSRGSKMPFMQLFLRDGIVYFFAIFSANLLNVVVYLSVSEESLKPFFAPFSEIMTSIMINRVVLNLRNFHASDPQASSTSHPSVPHDLGKARESRRISWSGRAYPTGHARTNEQLNDGRDRYRPRTPAGFAAIQRNTEIYTRRDEEEVIPMVDFRRPRGGEPREMP
ncbi:hypothetical protein PUNSTDRAFT_133965 [Punctularia strigosozonata HHB-11173 SS5]|uniref:uncharacterized protein n=1 Tax=Punctularia strigosozonata (strain HHB-11173) TaxID=741275 RepID=UPI0004417927|nr:uncharacterized protein PUNSTDRAFT_133965 [Punctularia strigosozonata HHB-11173 SS5]EIN08784.1 hypothetical protein PUNSTDRAFT_133965 [Punctularia strigosozonata HHB-11173 SS5]